MCGIAGFIHEGEDPREHHNIINRMLTAIRYRGPDEIGSCFDNNAAVGAVRLSIIDLKSGQQPMSSRDGRYWLCFNGEIFNYIEVRALLVARGRQFTTNSDTEVLLSALIEWGEEAVSRLNGQFGFAFYDRRQRTLLLGRDRFGERPLYYIARPGLLIFGSEVKALLQHPAVTPELCASSIGGLFRLWTNLPGRTCFKGVRSLPPGHTLRYRLGNVEVNSYYRLPTYEPAKTIKFAYALEAVRHHLTESVKLRLRSDVPVGVFLSGGLDSTIVTALARQQLRGPLETYSVEFDDRDFDESSYQLEAARRYETEHRSIRITGSDIVNAFPDVVRHAETALFRSAPAPMYLLAKEVSGSGLKVILSGEGADEGFLGYDIFKEAIFRAHYESLSNEQRRAALGGLYPYMASLTLDNNEGLLRTLASFAGKGTDPLFSHQMRFSLGRYAERLLLEPTTNAEALLLEDLQGRHPGFDALPLLLRAQIIEYSTLLEGYLLSSQGDRMTTAHGVEGRSPFLDPELVNFAFSLPEDLKLHQGSNEKFLLKEAFREMLPTSIYQRAKQPYRAPDCRAFLGRLDDGWVADILSYESVKSCGLFKIENVSQFLRRLKSLKPAVISQRDDQAFMLLISTLLLHRQFICETHRGDVTEFSDFSVLEDARQ